LLIAAQIRAARSALGWSAAQLASKSGLSLRTIQTVETKDGPDAVRKSSLLAIQSVLESAGIEFIGSADNAPGIRIHFRDR
jgi:transcriptional regulator with XRE-family HTH domain